MRSSSHSPKHKTEEPDPTRTTLLNIIKKNLKVNILEKLEQLVLISSFRASSSMANNQSNG
jgi:hypothetical protein